MQSILALRFANGMLEPIWRREYVDHVQITAAETIGVEGAAASTSRRARCATWCRTTCSSSSAWWRWSRRTPSTPRRCAARRPRCRGRAADRAAGTPCAASTWRAQEAGPSSATGTSRTWPGLDTETYVALKLEIENWRWAGVPFYLRTGKRMAERLTEIAIHFKPPPFRLFRERPVTGSRRT